MDIQKYIKDEGFSPFASDETVLETMKAQSEAVSYTHLTLPTSDLV